MIACIYFCLGTSEIQSVGSLLCDSSDDNIGK